MRHKIEADRQMVGRTAEPLEPSAAQGYDESTRIVLHVGERFGAR
jgi:hypothetical protein